MKAFGLVVDRQKQGGLGVCEIAAGCRPIHFGQRVKVRHKVELATIGFWRYQLNSFPIILAIQGDWHQSAKIIGLRYASQWQVHN